MATGEKRNNTWRKVFNWLSYLLTAIGVTVLVGTMGVYAYGAYEQYQFEQSLAEFRLHAAQERQSPPPSPPAPAQAAPPAEIDGTSAETPSPMAIPIAPITVVAEEPERVVIPSIKVDSPIVQAKIEDGEWQVPKFVAGHLEGTAKPAESGNVALSGHVQSISSGNVFAHLKDVEVGDKIIVYTQDERFLYEVIETKAVKNTDLSVVQPTNERIVTLITCTGTWLPLARDYSHRQVVIGQLTGVEPIEGEDLFK